jgi:NADPH:quinone reductase-like Zn-dependent oxidoreductase
MDFVGTVVRVGDAVKDLQVGVKVCGALGVGQQFWGMGSLCEYVCVPEELVARVPERLLEGKGMRVREAVGCGVAGQTAALVSLSFSSCLFLALERV